MDSNAADLAIRVRTRKGLRKNKKEPERKADLENDIWATNVQPTSVRCRACGATIRLDKRGTYYDGLWNKHREGCLERQKLLAVFSSFPKFGFYRIGSMTMKVE